MEAKELLRAGRLSEAREKLVAEVKKAPTNLSVRTLLFQTLALTGEWDKAERHLDAIVQQDANTETGVQVYKNLLSAERERIAVISQGQRPNTFPDAPLYLDIYLAAWQAITEKKLDIANELYQQVAKLVPQLTGTLNGKAFSGVIDTDQFLSRFLEVFTFERYVWVPFESIRELIIEPPKTSFDLIWIPAEITTWNALKINCVLPVLYPESYSHADERVKMGRMTDWSILHGEYAKGVGQHVLQFGDEDVGLLDIREIIFTAHQ